MRHPHRFEFPLCLAMLIALVMPRTAHADARVTGVIRGGDEAVAPYSLSILRSDGMIEDTQYPDADGAYDFTVPAGDYILRIISELPWITDQRFPLSLKDGKQTMDVTLKRAPIATISIRDESGQPISGARLHNGAYVGVDTATSDAQGIAKLAIPILDGMPVHFDAPGFLPRTVHIGVVGQPGVTLLRGGSITGRAADAPAGHPVRVLYQPRHGPRRLFETKLDAQGRFTIDGLDASEGRLSVLVPGVTAVLVDPVKVSRPEVTDLGVIAPIRDSDLRIRTLDADASPIEGAEVTLIYDMWTFFEWRGVTGADGAVEFTGIPEGRISIAVDPGDDWCTAEQPGVVLKAKDLAEGAGLDVLCDRAVTLLGVVKTPEPSGDFRQIGRAHAVTITAQATRAPVREVWMGSTDPEHPDQLRIPHCRPGRWHLTLEVGSWQAAIRDHLIPSPGPGTQTHDLGTIELEPARRFMPPSQ